jgi:phosphopantetheine adenylyltransferase
MKTFLSFILEASASQQAARLGLEGDGHGGWYKDGEFAAKTVKGQLKFYNKRQRIGAKDPAQTELEKNVSDPNFVDPSLQQQQVPVQQQVSPEQPVAQESPPINYIPVEKTKGTLTIAFGRFNPPHMGHMQLMDTAAASAEQEGSDYMIIPSRSQDKKKNPLDADTKVSVMRQMFPQHSERIMNDANTKTIFDVLKKAHNDGYANVRIVGGADRVKEFEKLSNNYNGNLYQFDNIEVISAGDRDPDAEGVEGLSASRMRLAAAENDFKTFRSGMPPEMRPKDVRAIFDTVRASMGISDGVVETWEIAPKYDLNSLREQYISNNIFNVGNLVENLNTGIIGRIIRRGTNYLICVSEDNIMFKSWIKDLMEVNYFNKPTNKGGVSADKRLVGTDSYRKYVESMVPGSSWGMQFINKYRKK